MRIYTHKQDPETASEKGRGGRAEDQRNYYDHQMAETRPKAPKGKMGNEDGRQGHKDRPGPTGRHVPAHEDKENKTMTKYVYIRSESNLWTVGFYAPDGKWIPESDHDTPEKAAARVHYLNGKK